jgi:serine/threonine protein kinase
VEDDTDPFVALIGAYGELRAEVPSPERIRRLGRFVVDLLRVSGIEAALRGHESPTVAFRHDGQSFLMGLAWTEDALGGQAAAELVQSLHATAGGNTAILLSMSGFGPQTIDAALRTPYARMLLWDRAHLEAALCGLVTASDLVLASTRVALFEAVPYATLTRLLAGADDPACPRMATPDLLPAPWPVLREPYQGIPAEVALVGEDGWDLPSGIAALGTDRLVVVTAGGLVALDSRRGTTSWMMRLPPGCTDVPLVLPDGSVLAVCNRAVVRVSGGLMETVAGGFSGNVRLLAGPDGEPWVLSGVGPMFGDERGTLALTRIGECVGDQHRYDFQFNADVQTAGWLERRRFFIAAAGNSAVVDLNGSSRVGEDEWIESPHGYPPYVLVIDRHGLIIAASHYTGLGVTLWRTNVLTRSSEEIAALVLNSVQGLCAAPDGTGYLLGDVYAARNGSRDPWPVLLRLPGLHPPDPAPRQPPPVAEAGVQVIETPPAVPIAVAAETADTSSDLYDAVRLAARGKRRDYALEPSPLDDGGQAEVFRARHKSSDLFVAFKRLRATNADAVARMRREIDIARALGNNPRVMPILDHSDRYEWFVMPLADHTAAIVQSALIQPQALRDLVIAVCDALRPAHALGWIHRDLKPANLLSLNGVWTVADWGYTRRPRGQTSNADRTRVGALLGTEGFAAPELSVDAHQAGPQADIYSIGQIIGWALRREWPRANTPLLPASGPWRHVVRAATQIDPTRRPATVDALVELIHQELDYDQPDDSDPAAQLGFAANDGDIAAALRLFGLALRYPDDLDLYTEVLGRLNRDAVQAAVSGDRQQAAEVVRAMKHHLYDVGRLSFGDADRIITWLHWIEMWAAEADDLDLLRDATEAVLAWDAHWDQGIPQRSIKAWMASLRGDAAAVVAGALREHRDAAQHFEDLWNDRRVDERIRRAVRSTPPRAPGIRN